MKKKIKQKIYDTDKAKCLGCWVSGVRNDPHYIKEELFQKKTGEFFIHGQGAHLSRYAERVDEKVWTYGEKIIPLNYEEAEKWSKEHLQTEEYNKIFAEIVGDERKTALNIYISTTVLEKAKREAIKRGVTISAFIEEKLEENL